MNPEDTSHLSRGSKCLEPVIYPKLIVSRVFNYENSNLALLATVLDVSRHSGR